MRHKNLKRYGFTLVELLVAAGIIALLLGLVAITYPNINEREQLTRAVDRLRTGLLTARLWARRDNIVTGVRFDSNGEFFTYVQQPMEDWSGYVSGFSSGLNDPIINITRFGNLSSPNPSIDYIKRLKPGRDYLVVEGDVAHRIAQLPPPIGVSSTSGTVFLESPISIPIGPSPLGGYKIPFRIVRGVEEIPLQENTVLGDRISVTSLPPLPLYQILFLPDGQVANQMTNQVEFIITQQPINPNDLPETASVTLDCLSGTTKYRNP